MRTGGEREPVIAIDGPAGAGKSTVARLLAERLGYHLVPTGAMYRAVALAVTRAGLPLSDTPELRRLLASLEVAVADGRVYLGDEDVTAELWSETIGRATSALTTLAAVREKVTPLQRREATRGGVVLEGRDTGTIVCPDAEVKFYLTASIEARTRRRHAELLGKGIVAELPAIRQELRARDVQDETRALAPLRKAPDAIEVDTSDLSVDQVVDLMLAEIERRGFAQPQAARPPRRADTDFAQPQAARPPRRAD